VRRSIIILSVGHLPLRRHTHEWLYIQAGSSTRSPIDTDTHPIMGLFMLMQRPTTFDASFFFFFTKEKTVLSPPATIQF
jgi:hypothetical protein